MNRKNTVIPIFVAINIIEFLSRGYNPGKNGQSGYCERLYLAVTMGNRTLNNSSANVFLSVHTDNVRTLYTI